MEENKIIIKPKMRITLLDSELRCISDRLVDQATEFMQGAKVKHTDPIKLEVILTSKIQKMWGLGTPQDLEYFVKNFDK